MSIDLDDIESRIAEGIYGDDRLSKERRNDAFSALAEIIAEVERLRRALDATEKERDQWHDAALDRRQALHDADALRTGVFLALSPEGGVNGWRPSRGVDALIDLALTVREDAEQAAQEERADVVAWLRGEPERLVACDGHRHADGKPCFVLSPMPADELADAIERGEHRREGEK